MTDRASPRGYLPIDGIADYDRAVRAMVLGADSDAIALAPRRDGAGVGRHRRPQGRRRFPAPVRAWRTGLDQRPQLGKPPRAVRGRRLQGQDLSLLRREDARPRFRRDDAPRLAALPPAPIVVLHACCHNPTGADPTPEQWAKIIEVVRARGLVPFLDIAYQGFADGIDADGAVVRSFAATPGPLFVVDSFSKSFSLYGERVGALTVVAGDDDEAARVLSQLKRIIRANYSTPPTHGGQIVTTVLASPELRALWEAELATMRDRIKLMRAMLVERLHERIPDCGFPLHAAAARDVLVFGPDQSAGRAPARGVLRLRDRYRAHLRRRAQFAQRRRRRRPRSPLSRT